MTKIVFKTIHGSRAYNLDTINSDLDVRGVFFPKRENVLGLRPGPIVINGNGEDESYWEFKHFIHLCLNANPNVLETLFTPASMQTVDDKWFKPVLENKKTFLTSKCFDSFGGYARRNLHKLNQQPKNAPLVYKEAKDASHLMRLLFFLEDILKGKFTTFLESSDTRLMVLREIKSGGWEPKTIIEAANTKFEEISVFKDDLPPLTDDTVDFWDELVEDTLWRYFNEADK